MGRGLALAGCACGLCSLDSGLGGLEQRHRTDRKQSNHRAMRRCVCCSVLTVRLEKERKSALLTVSVNPRRCLQSLASTGQAFFF